MTLYQYRFGSVYRGRRGFWVWSNLVYGCESPCYIDRCVHTGRVLVNEGKPQNGYEYALTGIDGLEFA